MPSKDKDKGVVLETPSGVRFRISEKDLIPVYKMTRGICVSAGVGKRKYKYIHVKNGNRYEGLHRVLMSCPKNMFVDHINGDTLDNRRSNLRVVTRSQNNANRRFSTGKSKYKGVHFQYKKWTACIAFNGERRYLGSFETEEEAATRYNREAKRFHGEYANLNKIKTKKG